MFSKKQGQQAQQILNSLYLHGPISRADLSRLLKITPATVTELTGRLISDGILIEGDEDPSDSGVGRKKILLEIVPNYRYFAGFELSDNKLVCSLMDNLGQPVATKVIRGSRELSFPLTEDQTAELMLSFLSENQSVTVSAIGLAIPGHYHKTEDRILSNRSLWSSFDLGRIRNRLSVPLFIKNNVKCMALSKLYLQADKANRNFIFVNVRHGIFAAHVHQGDLYADDNYLVGEIGHSVVNPNGEECECGLSGCLQTYASSAWIVKKAKIAYQTGKTLHLQHLVGHQDELTLEHVLQAYHLGEEMLYQIIEQAITYLAQQLSNMLVLVDAKVIYIHGKLFEDQVIADKLQRRLRTTRSIIEVDSKNDMEVLPYNPYLGSIGAAALALRQDLIFGYR